MFICVNNFISSFCSANNFTLLIIYFSFLSFKWTSRAEIAQSVQRWATGWAAEELVFDSRQGQRFFLLHTVQTGPEAHQAMGAGSSFPGVKL
jgi:hypothetical protein